jgi:hypothetical protein
VTHHRVRDTKVEITQRDLSRRIAATSVLSAFIGVYRRPDMLFVRPNPKIKNLILAADKRR